MKEFHLFRGHGLLQRDALLASNREHREIVAALKARGPQVELRRSFRHVANGKQRMLMALEDLAEQARRPPGAAESIRMTILRSGGSQIRRGRGARVAPRALRDRWNFADGWRFSYGKGRR